MGLLGVIKEVDREELELSQLVLDQTTHTQPSNAHTLADAHMHTHKHTCKCTHTYRPHTYTHISTIQILNPLAARR